jgi:hypothetical protein
MPAPSAPSSPPVEGGKIDDGDGVAGPGGTLERTVDGSAGEEDQVGSGNAQGGWQQAAAAFESGEVASYFPLKKML